MLRHRESVRTNGATRLLALFDTSFPCREFYAFFLRRVIADPRWGLLIKPKTVRLPWVRQHLPELQSLYEEAMATGRVQMLNSRLSPAYGAAAADFSVSVSIQSAGVVAALAGHRTIHLDYLRLQDGPLSRWADLYNAGPDRIVFNDPELLWEALNRYFDEPGSAPDLGLADNDLLTEIDHFRDEKAGQRIGDYIRWYLEALDRGLQRDDALTEATRYYANKWSEHSVLNGLTKDSRSGPLARI